MIRIYKHDKEVFSSDSLQVMVDLQKHFKSWDKVDATVGNLANAVIKLGMLEGFKTIPQFQEELQPLHEFVTEQYDSMVKQACEEKDSSELSSFCFTVEFEEEW